MGMTYLFKNERGESDFPWFFVIFIVLPIAGIWFSDDDDEKEVKVEVEATEEHSNQEAREEVADKVKSGLNDVKKKIEDARDEYLSEDKSESVKSESEEEEVKTEEKEVDSDPFFGDKNFDQEDRY